MSLPRRSRSARAESLSPAEALAVAHTLLVVVVAAWAGGGMTTWAPATLLALTALSLPLWLQRAREGAPVRPLALLPAALWALYVALALLNPSHAPAPDGTWHERAGWLHWLPTTADRAHTLAGAAPWLAALLQGGAMAGLALSRRAVSLVWRGVALNAFVLAAVGAGFHFLGATRMLGEFEVPEPTYFFATFYYKNHWAAFGALGGLAGVALALADWRAALAGAPDARGRVIFFGGTALLTLCTLPLPGSRGGLLLAAAILFGGVGRAFVGLRSDAAAAGRRWGVALLATLVLAAAGFVGEFYLQRGADDLARTQRQLTRHAAGGLLDLRVELARDTWRMAQARPVFGWGVGCYEVVFPVFAGDYLRDARGRPEARVEFAHNDWLQLLAESGFVGALLLLGAAALAWMRSWRVAGSAGRWALALALLLPVYAWIDFPFHNPAVLLTWTVLIVTAGGLRSERALV